MMSILPEFLLNSYENLYSCELVRFKIINPDTIAEFVNILNTAIPKKYTAEYTIYLFNRTKYKINRWKFIKDINDSPYKSMVLWTNYKEILRHFDLVQKFYLKWDKELNIYTGDLYDPTKHTQQEHETNFKEKLQEENTTESLKEDNVDTTTNLNEKSETEKKVEEYMDDQDRLIEYMQKRKRELEKKESQKCEE